MGLDMVEFVMEVEDAFQVSLSDEDYSTLETPRDLVAWVARHVPCTESTPCLSLRAFSSLRKAMVEQLEIDRRNVRPTTKLLDLLPSHDRRASWKRIGASLSMQRWPRVRGIGWLSRLLAHVETVGDAARHIVAYAPRAVKPPNEGWSTAEIIAVVYELMRYQLGLREFSIDARFADLFD